MEEKTYHIFYLVGFIVSIVVMLLLILFGDTSLNFTFLIFFYVVRFLSGFGLILSIANGFLILMDKTSKKLGKKAVNVFLVFQVVIPIILLIYATYKIFSSYSGGGGISMSGVWSEALVWFDNIIYIYGIVSLLLQLYIIPIIQDEISEAVELGKISWWKKKAKGVGRGIKKKYFNLRKEYGKAQVQDQMTVKEVLDLWRRKFAVILLIVIAIGSFLFTPVAFICVMFWIKLYFLFRNPTYKYERIALLASMFWVGFIAVITPFIQLGIYETIGGYMWTINIFYMLGILLGSLIFIKKLLNLQGITWVNLKLKRRESKIKSLEEEKDELKKQLEDKKKAEKQEKKSNKTEKKQEKKTKKN